MSSCQSSMSLHPELPAGFLKAVIQMRLIIKWLSIDKLDSVSLLFSSQSLTKRALYFTLSIGRVIGLLKRIL